jgi:hypothetical protein
VNYLEIKMNKKDKELDEFFAGLEKVSPGIPYEGQVGIPQPQVVEIPSFNPATVIAQDAPPESDVGQLHTIRGPFQTGTGGVVMNSAGQPITSPKASDSYYTLLDQNGAYVQPQKAQQGAPGKGAGGK